VRHLLGARDDERLRLAAAQPVDVLRHYLLSSAALPLDEEGNVAEGDRPDHTLEIDHAGRLADERRIERGHGAAFPLLPQIDEVASVEKRLEQIEERGGLRYAIIDEAG
jgi:hypothetical protein